MRLSLFITIFLTVFSVIVAQKSLEISSDSKCIVYGTSSLHDWHLDANELSGKVSVSIKNGRVSTISSLDFSVTVKQLLSGKSGMDKNTFKALNEPDYPLINYEFVRIISRTDKEDGQMLSTGGKLTIAGKTKSVYLDVLCSPTSNGIQFSGNTTFNMSDYGVKPPTALMGTIKTGDEIKVEFSVQYQ